MIRLGHIDYSNCVPVHALLLEAAQPGLELVHGVPADLNAALAAGAIDAAPCSSIEYARHADSYLILPGPAIGSDGAVQSILLESALPLRRLADAKVAVPTASATSVVLLRALLELRLGVRPRLVWYDQAATHDPIGEGAAAAVLRIGDIALRRQAPAGRVVHDLGLEWKEWTGLPFAFAVWHVRREVPASDAAALAQLLDRSRGFFARDSDRIAAGYAPRYGLSTQRLLDYWASLRFDLDPAMQRGLLHFYELAAALGECPRTDTLHFADIQGGPGGR
jgi:chorismate dehydratase